ncbi:MAG TPA: potassium-transporting ATPase subunit KdpA [Candidatus Acidoferrales bacterium]|nr:potassium-transporting ATPase subunit KdpA [Candidatus Acidoferrales bacterium]
MAGKVLAMTANGWFQIGLYVVILLAITKPLGVYMARVFSGERTFFDPIARPVERLLYRVTGVDEKSEMRWTEYAFSMLIFSVVSLVLLYAIERLQYWLPWNPQRIAGVAPALAFNTAVSFTTNTNWQVYSGETAMSYLTQMAGLAYHNFVSAATGIAMAIASIRGIARKEKNTIGNFWVDFTRATLWILLPLCLIIGLFLVSQGTIQNLKPYTTVPLMDPQTVQVTGADGKTAQQTITEQVIAQGPVASQEAIKMLGTNGGGFFNANSAHPFENPTPLSDFAQILLIFSIGSGLTYTLGRMTGSQKHGWAVWGAMTVLFLAGVAAAYTAESRGNPLLHGIDQKASATQPGGNMEGKEVRFGIARSALFATITTDASCGAVNGVHDSFTPLGGMVPMINMMLGEVVFGGVGAGLYGMIVFVILSVFIAGLMVGRTPEYLGKKIEAYDVKMAMLSVLIFCVIILVFTAIGVVTPYGKAGISNPGPHGLSQILYAYTSGAANNGSAFAGINGNTPWYNVSMAFDMLLGRFFMVIPVLAIAGNLARKKIVPESAGTFPVTTPLFSGLLISVILVVSALTFFPALSLGPILEHLLLRAGRVF